jgi:hypothetical protein
MENNITKSEDIQPDKEVVDEKNTNNEKNKDKFYKTKSFQIFLFVIGGLLAILLIFNIGMNIGFRKAEFSYEWGDNYYKNFAGPSGGFINDFGHDDFIQAHGVFGQIIKIDGLNLIINSNEKTEKIILINNDTIIRRFRDSLKSADLKVNDFLVVIGQPNEAGQIEAKLIRLMPPPPTDNNYMWLGPNTPLSPVLH